MRRSLSPVGATTISGRYCLSGALGAGGMATVHRAVDTTTGAELALKRLRAREGDDSRQRGIAHLEHEFHTLSQLRHPRIVSVFDYGVDGVEPYYTMELLDGGDLHARTPLDYRAACGFAADICSALSLLHSRRLVHRDLSPRNVRCTNDGHAKLIDFGAMARMGPTKTLVGTPAVCAPELVRLQAVDGRTDLYALGSTLYFTLTGRYPYPARTFGQLESMWKARLPAPSELVDGIPAALDELLLSLLQLDASLRPASAAEVMQRLAVIAGRTMDEQLLVPLAYLTTPSIVGRSVLLGRVRRYAAGLLRGRGRALLVEGAEGVGRTRLLDACVLEAKLIGALVARADASDASAGEYGVVRALGRGLLQVASEIAVAAAGPELALLASAVPELADHAAAAGYTVAPCAPAASDLQSALRKWFCKMSKQRPVLLAVDDLQHADDASASLIALLAQDVKRNRLMLASSLVTGVTRSPAHKLFADASVKLELSALTSEETYDLLCSVFGDVPNLQRLASRVHTVSQGRPRDALQLVQHLADKEVLRYVAGAWSLPAAIDAADLPTSMSDALAARVAVLSDDARRLARAFALGGNSQLTLEECGSLLQQPDMAYVRRALDELLIATVAVQLTDTKYALGPQGWQSALLAAGPVARERELQVGLAHVYERRGEGFLAAKHSFAAGNDAHGLELLVAHAEATQRATDADTGAFLKLLLALPTGWLSVYEHAYEMCRTLGRPKRELFVLQRRVLSLAAYDPDCGASRHNYTGVFAQLLHDTGLDIYGSLDPALPSGTRMVKALTLAKARFDALPEHERVFEPAGALEQLARAVLTCLAAASTSLDLMLLRELPSLEPVAALSPALELVHMIVVGAIARISGRTQDARLMYNNLLQRLEQLGPETLDRTYRVTTELGIAFITANLDAALGLESSLKFAERIAAHPFHEINALHVRGLFSLWQADPQAADRMRARAELLMVQRVRSSPLEGTHLLRAIVAHALSDDLTRAQQCIDAVALMAGRFSDWLPVLHYARGEHARIRGDLPAALAELDQALAIAAAGEHQIWVHAAAARMQTLCACGAYADARAWGEQQLAAAEQAGLGVLCNFIRMPLAIANVQVGEVEAATALARQVIAQYVSLGSKGLNLALAYETAVWVSLLAGDAAATERNLDSFAQQLRAGTCVTLTTRLVRLRRAAQAAFHDTSADYDDALENPRDAHIEAALTACADAEERAQRSLDILLAETGSSQGFLFAVTNEGCTLAAQRAEHELPPEIEAMVRSSLAAERSDEDATGELDENCSTGAAQGWTSEAGRTYRSVLLGHTGDNGFVITGLGLLVVNPELPFTHPAQIATEISRCAGLQRERPRFSIAP